ncbi:MAG: sulfatase-like hydrolase/transferase [Bacteroidetes bacterium]|jgi:arylsulfatase A-like enzyme|nr:sulfatase-like hydrolase/transferase [Bacteroidota bacterium]MBT3749239.1 sulfatase-like hydrolase/transferase [Bacteroidota bacterium]MBT4400849.1 sulfatase-like hydrolase/transferase [Bacteroidota bacterium]MBT4409532.1 sulfatase-like hydrolase/transferase [Bacteroidota bacterium]MBT7466202.1 sulfatase-like hydrolase/transferase [Bacteroidota bacterium]
MGLDTLKEANPGEKRYQNNPNYAAMVQHMDENVGRVIDCLTELNLDEKTVLIFTSDNGGKGSVTSNYPLKGMKHNLDEGGIRVPLIVRWAGQTKPGSISDIPLISNDFYPSFLEFAGAPLRPEQHMDGLSFKDLLLAKTSQLDREAIFWHYPHSRMEGAVRKGDFKLLLNYKTGESQLYNLREDISETKDLSSQYPEKIIDMEKLLKGWLKQVDAKFPKELCVEIKVSVN